MLSVDKGEGPDTIDDLTELEERQKLVIEISNKKSVAKAPSPKKTMLSKPKIGGLTKPVVR